MKVEPKEEAVEVAADGLFGGLPPPSSSSYSSIAAPENKQPSSSSSSSRIKFEGAIFTVKSEPFDSPSPAVGDVSIPVPPPPLRSALKSAMKRPKPPESSQPSDAALPPEKRIKFKMTTEASEEKVVEAMQKIALHIKNASKLGKASKLAIQLIQAGSVKPGTSDHFFAILEAAMSSSLPCTDPSVRADYHALFTASQDVISCFDWKQQNRLITWTMRAVLANDLFTDDSFVFSKAMGLIKEAISSLPFATVDEDAEEAEPLNSAQDAENVDTSSEGKENNKADPFGLEALIPTESKKEDKLKGKKNAATRYYNEEEMETKQFLKSKREALIVCLEIAARRYKSTWCQTGIDILVKYAFDNVTRFTSQQREAIDKLWASVRDQQIRRKQGKSVTGKLDMNAFERLQEKYSNEKISIRRAVGGAGGRQAQQWLG